MNNTNGEPSASKIEVERGQEHVLVVEDDDIVREQVVRQINSLGHRGSKASGGLTGLEIIRERAHIDLLFTDVVLFYWAERLVISPRKPYGCAPICASY